MKPFLNIKKFIAEYLNKKIKPIKIGDYEF